MPSNLSIEALGSSDTEVMNWTKPRDIQLEIEEQEDEKQTGGSRKVSICTLTIYRANLPVNSMILKFRTHRYGNAVERGGRKISAGQMRTGISLAVVSGEREILGHFGPSSPTWTDYIRQQIRPMKCHRVDSGPAVENETALVRVTTFPSTTSILALASSRSTHACQWSLPVYGFSRLSFSQVTVGVGFRCAHSKWLKPPTAASPSSEALQVGDADNMLAFDITIGRLENSLPNDKHIEPLRILGDNWVRFESPYGARGIRMPKKLVGNSGRQISPQQSPVDGTSFMAVARASHTVELLSAPSRPKAGYIAVRAAVSVEPFANH
ncbi:hypothetical protein B0H14DRAFT_2563772 [Mycena olivaceomarginata]|nr:hypothetical protein B0H14DRAFT_2563772 [Mycena olivaceomarginata]